MNKEGFFNYNGKIYKNGATVISPDNRSFRYGDGCFETIKLIKGKIVLASFHFERLFSSMETLQFEKPNYITASSLARQIEELAKKNSHDSLARIRLTVFRGNGGLYDAENNFSNYLIQTWQLNDTNNKLNENGLVIDVYKDARKVCDHFSHIKSNNFLCYAMGALWAKKNHLNDALLLNPYDHISDATIANIFIIKNGIIKTPALSEGCINGNMRRYLLKCLREENFPVEETKISIDDLLQASEVFLTNAIYGIKWVKQLGETNYQNQMSVLLHKKFIQPLFS